MNAIVTGATKGIGRAITDVLADAGYNIGICARHENDLDRLVTSLSEQYPAQKFAARPTDVSIKKEVLSFADRMLDTFKHIDVLINNAGIFLPGAVHEEEDEVFERQMSTNLYSAYYLSKRIIPVMKQAGKGHIFNMCSVASIKAYPNGGSYGMSKFGLLALSKSLREELKPHGIKVTSILPGATWSASWEGADLPQKRLMPPEDIAESVMSALRMSNQSVVEEILIRPQLGDL